MTTKINFNEYEPIDILDAEEQAIWNSVQSGEYESILTTKNREYSTLYRINK